MSLDMILLAFEATDAEVRTEFFFAIFSPPFRKNGLGEQNKTKKEENDTALAEAA